MSSQQQRLVVQQKAQDLSRLTQNGSITPGTSSYHIWESGYESAKFRLAGELYYEGIKEEVRGRAKISEAISLLEGYGQYVARSIAEGSTEFNAIDLTNVQEELVEWRRKL